ncbi:hypothetical protein Pryu01_00804 [Paraliobacillus ryukyuensis]|uniref:Competence protein ComK n=1 Tax=Paraliobacillus ryukyuensis TaxID=200904 RepID=A0A366EE77_9BACI|nr:competence protein ComK [Paraliobacillus ryukyuensis]RBP00623.1 competence protein ComK [Paraliobacillus ryukyuensis]
MGHIKQNYSNTICKHYIVSNNTLAIVPVRAINFDAIAYEKERTIQVRQTPLQIIKASCIHHGATYEGRRRASCHLLGLVQKVPIVMNERPLIYSFPSQSAHNFSASWVFAKHILHITAHPNKAIQQTIITFHNKQQLFLNESTYAPTNKAMYL